MVLGVSKDHCNKLTQVADFLRRTEMQETACLSISVICVPPCVYNKETLVAMDVKGHA